MAVCGRFGGFQWEIRRFRAAVWARHAKKTTAFCNEVVLQGRGLQRSACTSVA